MPRQAIGVLLAVIVGVIVFMLRTVEHTGGQPLVDQKFSDLQSKVDAMAARPSSVGDGRQQSDTALERGFELYRDRGKLNMRRGLSITLVGFPSDNRHIDVVAFEECRLMQATFALKCVMLEAKTVSETLTSSSKRKMRMSLAFQERGPSSVFQNSARERFRMATKSITTFDNGNDPVAAREKLYRDIGGVCSTLTAGGDCSLLAGKIEFTHTRGNVIGNGEIIVGYLDPQT